MAIGDGLQRAHMNFSPEAWKWIKEHTAAGMESEARTVDIAARESKARRLAPVKPTGPFRPLNVHVTSALIALFGSAENVRDSVEAAATAMPVLQRLAGPERGDDLFEFQIDPLDDRELCGTAIRERATAEYVRRRHVMEMSTRVDRFLNNFGESAQIIRVWRPEKQRHEIFRRCKELDLDPHTVQEVFSKQLLLERR
jgi:hypothetical protein